MAAKILILAFAAVIWKAQSQQCVGRPNFPGPFRSLLGSITAESSDCPSPVTSCCPDTSICQGPSNPNIACTRLCNSTPAGATGACTSNECSPLRPLTSRLKGNLTPLISSRDINLPCAETETALSSEFTRSSCLPTRQPLRPTSCYPQTCSQELEEISRPPACPVTETFSTNFRTIPQNCRPQFAACGSANAEASSTVSEGISSAYRGKINPFTLSTATATSEAASAVNIKPNLYSSNTRSGFNNMVAPVSTSAYSEAASSASVGSSFAPTIGSNIQASQVNTAASSEAASAVNIRPPSMFNPNAVSSSNYLPSQVSSTASSEASSSASVGSSYTPNIFGGYNNFVTPLSATATSEAESSANLRSKVFNTNEFGGFNNLISPVSTAAFSESISSGTSYKPNIYGDYSNFLPTTSESTCCTRPCTCNPNPPSCLNSVRPCNAYCPNEIGCSNNLGSQISSIASSEASSLASVGPSLSPFISGGFNNFATASSEAESLSNIRLANTPYLCGGLNNLVPLTCASSNAEASSSVSIDPSKVLPPSLCGGLPKLVIPENICAMETSQRCCNGEPPRLYTTSCSFTTPPNYLPVGTLAVFNSIPPTPCGVPNYISSPYQQDLISSLNPMVANLCELTNLISSIVPIVEMVDTTYLPTSYNFLPETSCLPVCDGMESPVSVKQTSISTAEACSSSGITDGIGRLNDIVSSTASAATSSSSVSSLEPITCVPNLLSIIETISPAPLAEVATSASSTSTSSSTIVTDLNNPNTPCDDESSIITSTSATSSSAVEVTNVLQDVPEIPLRPIEASTCQEASLPSISASSSSSSSSSASSSSSSASSSSSSTASSSTSTSITSSTSSCVTPSSFNQYQLGVSPLTLEVQIPSCISPSFLSCGLLGGATETLSAMNSCQSASSSLPVYELQIPSSIPAHLSCSLGSVPSNVPVLCMNLEPAPSRMYSFSC